MYCRTDDPIADFADYDAERQRELDKFPKCDNCGEPITDEYFYNIDGTYICETCMRDEYRKNTDDYMED